MSTGIQWTDETLNLAPGCTPISPGCKNCFARTLHTQRYNAFLAGKTIVSKNYHQPFDVVQLRPDLILKPFSWREPRRIFVESMGDIFHVDVPDAFLDRVFAMMALTPRHRYQLLTKRAKRMHDYFATPNVDHRVREQAIELAKTRGLGLPPGFQWPLPNVWLGVSTENQQLLDERVPYLQATPAAVRFLSCEPLLGPLSFRPKAHNLDDMLRLLSSGDAARPALLDRIHWLIVGGESGPGSRPYDPEWARGIIRQAHEADVAVYHKQVGSNPIGLDVKHKMGGDANEWPLDLRVRQFPEPHPSSAKPLIAPVPR